VRDTRAAERDAQEMPTKTEHAEYLQSDQWQQLRKRVIADYPFCERCTMPRWLAEIAYDQDLHVHHKTYRNRGKEKLEDLEVLCRRCHDLESNGRTELKEVRSVVCSICKTAHWDRRADRCAYCARLLNEGPQGLMKYANEVPIGHMLDGRSDPTWDEIMPHVLSGTAIERQIAIRLAMRNPYLHETFADATVAQGLLCQIWVTFGSDQLLDFISALEQRFSPPKQYHPMTPLMEKK
jgi:hypothetical protein